MQQLKYVVIGAGASVLQMHQSALQQDWVNLCGMYNRNAKVGKVVAEQYKCKFYHDYKAMLHDAQADIAVILTSHPSHSDIACDCFEAGYHVLIEKPMAVSVEDADRMIAAASRANLQLGVCFQRRYMPSIIIASKLIQEGDLGDIQYVHQSITWTRPYRYFEERNWRGTWLGEGGGVLINQASHNLDMLCFLVGLPQTVKAWTRTQLHKIETEDTADALLSWANGATGTFHVSTAEFGSGNHLEIRGTKGYLLFNEFDLVHYQLAEDLKEYMRQNTNPYASPSGQFVDALVPTGIGDHKALYNDFHKAVLGQAQFLVRGESARTSLELANAMIYSSHIGSEIQLPINVDKYSQFLRQLQVRKDSDIE